MNLKSIIKRGLRYIIKGVPVFVVKAEIKVSPSTNSMKNRNVIITGGSKGLGFAIAKKSIDEGANVLIIGRTEETLQKACNDLGGHANYMVCDVSNVANYKCLFADAEKMFDGKIDSLVSNAGISLHEGNFRNVSEETWDRQMDTNLKGNYFLVKEFVEYLEGKDDKRGNIVVITSERAKRPDDIPYGLTKVATSSFIQSIARKVIEEGIRINGVGPGITASEMTGFKSDGDLFADVQAGKRVFIPEEVAEVVYFLLSDISNCISGEVITCDQGTWITNWPA